MTRRKKVRLHRLLLMASLRCFTVFVAMALVILLLFYEDSRRSSEAYVVSIANSMNESLNLLHSTLETVSRYLAVYEPLAELHQAGSQSLEDLESIYDMVALTVTYSDIVQDMAIVSDDGAYIYGYATAEDCGGGIRGNMIDLYFNTVAECYEFGRRSCTVYILD